MNKSCATYITAPTTFHSIFSFQIYLYKHLHCAISPRKIVVSLLQEPIIGSVGWNTTCTTTRQKWEESSSPYPSITWCWPVESNHITVVYNNIYQWGGIVRMWSACQAKQYLVDAAFVPWQAVNELARIKIPDAHKRVARPGSDFCSIWGESASQEIFLGAMSRSSEDSSAAALDRTKRPDNMLRRWVGFVNATPLNLFVNTYWIWLQKKRWKSFSSCFRYIKIYTWCERACCQKFMATISVPHKGTVVEKIVHGMST